MNNYKSYQKESVDMYSALSFCRVSNMIDNDNEVITKNVNHVFCIDISGSMCSELSKIRMHLKARLPEIVKNNDTVTLIYFADGKDCGIIKEFVNVSSKKDILELNALIDKYLVAKGCTDFVTPLVLSKKLIDACPNKEDSIFNFIFMSDGGHNCSSFEEVVNAMNNLKGSISSCTIISYGFWADEPRLQEMADTLGGSKIQDQDFESYSIDLENAINSIEGTPRVAFDISDFKSQMKYQMMFAINERQKSVISYSCDRVNEIFINKDTEELFFISKSKEMDEVISSGIPSVNFMRGIYSAIYTMSNKLNYDVVEKLLYYLGDKELIEKYCNSFGKQKLNEFQGMVLNRIFNDDLKSIELVSKNWKPNPKKYCVINFINDIIKDNAKLYLFDDNFNYTRTGAKAVTKRLLTDEQKALLSNASTKLKAEKILSSTDKYQPIMEYKNTKIGVPVNKLQWNKERANLSLQVGIDVTLTIQNNEVNIPVGTKIDSYIVRNYTIIKDGILNVTKLPLSMSNSLLGKMKRMKLVESIDETTYDVPVAVINISKLPIINKVLTESVSSTDLALLEVNALRNQIKMKYLKYLLENNSINKLDEVENNNNNSSASIFSKFNENQVKYLKEIGITNKGYSPKSELDYTGDYYMAVILKTSIDKFSSLPKINTILDKINNNKTLTISEYYFHEIINNIDSKIKASSLPNSKIINNLIDEIKEDQDNCLNKIAVSKFSIILSRKWFVDKKDLSDNSCYAFTVNGTDLNVTWSFKESKVSL